ncbi:lymphoid-restricted membrane protein-like, partial [Anoplophora glabripennis]|uniref:lymphoid-restricted membrane protein-like n=1 Tax=Anoplophora glabripennis TaxID=217634 RepID=UPI000874507E
MDSSASEDGTMEIVMKNIYTSCDPENSNLVPVSKLIEFITPYMLEDLSALESLRRSLDPGNNNVCVSSEKFYETMNEWTKKITNSSDEDSDFNRTPSVLEVIDEKQLPYIQSTPRASFGQKLLSCEGLLNLSNVSAYSLSTSTHTKDNSMGGQEKTILEEEIKRLEHHLNKVSNEMVMVKLQLTAAEEQNEILQADLDRCKTRLHSEQQIIEHLQSDKRYNDELREELNSTKKQVEELNKKLLQYEKENHHLVNDIKQSEKENAKLEEKCEELSRREQEAKKEIINIKTELDLKDQEIITILKINDELRSKLNQQRDTIDQLTNENELLDHLKNNLEKTLRDNLSARRDSLVHQYKTCLADSSNLPDIDQGSEDECFFKIQGTDHRNPARDSLHAEISQVIQEKNSPLYSHSLSSFNNHEKQIELENGCSNIIEIYEDEIKQLKIKNDSIQARLETVNQDNVKLCEEVAEVKDKMCILQQDLNNLIIEKRDKEASLEQIKEEKEKIENELKKLNQ